MGSGLQQRPVTSPHSPQSWCWWVGQRTRSPRIHPPTPQGLYAEMRTYCHLPPFFCLHSCLGRLYINNNMYIYNTYYLT